MDEARGVKPGRRTSNATLASLALCLVGLALTGAAWAQPHPATGVYERELGDRRLVIELHVAADGTLTGLSKSGRTAPGYYFEGSYSDGYATGFFHDPTTILAIAFILELREDVLAWTTYMGSAGQPPEPLPEPRYYLRQPGDGPTEPIPAPVEVLLQRDRNDAVMEVGAQGAELQLRDVRAVLAVALLAMREAGMEGALYPGRIYYYWVDYVTRGFRHAAPETQALMADSETWWPALEAGWSEAPAATRQRLAQDVLLMIFTRETVRGWLDEAAAGFQVEAGPRCTVLMSCVLRTFDEESFAAATQRLPCLSVDSCALPAEHD